MRPLPVPLRPFEIAPPRVIRTADLRAEHLRRGARRIYRGRAVFPRLAGPPDVRRDEMLMLVAAISSTPMARQWFCFEAAALVWGCDTVDLGPHVDLNQEFRQHRSPDLRVRRHHSVIPSDQLTTVDGFQVTSLARTVVDCARVLPGRRALVIADSAARHGLTSVETHQVLATLRGRRGVRRAGELLRLVDGGAGSPGETLTRWALVDQGLPQPSTQVAILTSLGLRYADLGWPRRRVVVEFDGSVKYSPVFSSDPAATVLDEKRRQEAIEEAGWIVLRVRWADLRDPSRLAAWARAAIARAHALRLGDR